MKNVCQLVVSKQKCLYFALPLKTRDFSSRYFSSLYPLLLLFLAPCVNIVVVLLIPFKLGVCLLPPKSCGFPARRGGCCSGLDARYNSTLLLSPQFLLFVLEERRTNKQTKTLAQYNFCVQKILLKGHNEHMYVYLIHHNLDYLLLLLVHIQIRV